MNLTILGSGTCVPKLPGMPLRHPPAFLLDWNGGTMLFDVSAGAAERLERAGRDPASVAHVAISHPHPDHCALVQHIQSVFMKGIWGGDAHKLPRLHLYVPAHIHDRFPEQWDFFLPETEGKPFPWPELIWNTMPAERPVAVGNAMLSAERVYHGFGKVDAVGFRLATPEGTFVYSGDTGECEGIRALAENADVFVCEASARVGDDETPTGYGHLTPRLAGEIAREGGVKTLVLFHHTGLDSDDAIREDVAHSSFAGTLVIGEDFHVIQS